MTTQELLLAVAGRVDDDLLAWARELVAVGEDARAVELLTAALIADRVALPEQVRAALVAAGQAGRSVLAADTALPPAAPEDGTAHVFVAPEVGPTTATVSATVRELFGRQDVDAQVWLSWRQTPAGSATGPLPRPVVLVELGGTGGDVLAHQLATALERAGVPASVEVVAQGAALLPYHEAARRGGRPLDEPVAEAAASAEPVAAVASEDVASEDFATEDVATEDGSAPRPVPAELDEAEDAAPATSPEAAGEDVPDAAPDADPVSEPVGDAPAPLFGTASADPDGVALPTRRRAGSSGPRWAGLGPIEPETAGSPGPADSPEPAEPVDEPAAWAVPWSTRVEPASSLFTPASAEGHGWESAAQPDAGSDAEPAAGSDEPSWRQPRTARWWSGREPWRPTVDAQEKASARHSAIDPAAIDPAAIDPAAIDPAPAADADQEAHGRHGVDPADAEPVPDSPAPAVVSAWWTSTGDPDRGDDAEPEIATSGPLAPIRRLRPSVHQSWADGSGSRDGAATPGGEFPADPRAAEASSGYPAGPRPAEPFPRWPRPVEANGGFPLGQRPGDVPAGARPDGADGPSPMRPRPRANSGEFPLAPRPVDSGGYRARPRPRPVEASDEFPARPAGYEAGGLFGDPRPGAPTPTSNRAAETNDVPLARPRSSETSGELPARPRPAPRPFPPAQPAVAEDPLSGPLREPLLAPLLDPTADDSPDRSADHRADPAASADLFASRTNGSGGFDPVPPARPLPPTGGRRRQPMPSPAPAAPRPSPGGTARPPARRPGLFGPGQPQPRPLPARESDAAATPEDELAIDPTRLGLRPDSIERLSPTDRALLARLQNEMGIRPADLRPPVPGPQPQPRPRRADPPDIAG